MSRIYARIVLGVFIVMSTILVFNRIELNNNESEFLVRAFSESEFNLEETELNMWTTYKSKYYTLEEMEDNLDGIVELLNLKDVEISRTERNENKIVEITKKAEYSTTSIKFIEVIEQLDGDIYKADNYIVVDIILKKKCTSISYYEKLLSDYFRGLGLESNISVMIIGSVPGRVTNAAAKHTMYGVINDLNGRITDAYTMDNAISMYGYSDRIDNSVTLNNDTINIDLSSHYNDIENKTYLYMATPVITRDY